jgi:uncharacterized membrane protein YhaH (DUF805 family)
MKHDLSDYSFYAAVVLLIVSIGLHVVDRVTANNDASAPLAAVALALSVVCLVVSLVSGLGITRKRN